MNTQNLPFKDGDKIVIPLSEQTFKNFRRTNQFSLSDESFAAVLGIFLEELLLWDDERFASLNIPRVGLVLYEGCNGGGTSGNSAVFMPTIYEMSEQRSLIKLSMGSFIASMSHAVQQTVDSCIGNDSMALRKRFHDFKFRVHQVQRIKSKAAQ